MATQVPFTPLALLENQKGGWNAVQSITRSLENNIAREIQKEQFAQTMQVRATEFGQTMALQQAEFDERKRMNMINAQNLRFTNEMKWKEFEAKQALAPIELESQRLRLEADKLRIAREQVASASQYMNSVTQPFDTSAAAYLSEIQDPRYGQAYLELKRKYAGLIASGKNFDPASYEAEFARLNESFGVAGDPDATGFASLRSPVSEYTPQVSQLLRQMGAEQVANDYEAKNNPQKRLEISSLRASGIVADEKELPLILQGLQQYMQPEEITSYFNSIIGIKGIDREIEKLEKQASAMAVTAASAATSDPARARAIRSEIDAIEAKISDKRKERDDLYRLATGQSPLVEPPAPSESDEVLEAIYEEMNNANLKNYGIQSPESPASFGAKLQQKQADNLSSVLDVDPDVTMGAGSWSYLAGKNVKTRRQDVKHIRSTILQEVRNLSDEELDSKIKSLASDQKKKDTVNKYISNFDGGLAYEENPLRYKEGYFSFASILSPAATVEEAIEFLEKIPDSDPKKRVYKESIYANLISGSMIGALSE